MTAGGKRTQPAAPRSVASAETRKDWPGLDAGLVLGAVEWGLARTRAALRRHDIAAALLVDPVNIRYITGTSVMPVWTLHSIDRYLLVPAEGEPVLWEYPSAPAEVTSAYPLLETRRATSWSIFGFGQHSTDRAGWFAAEVAGVLRERGIHDGRIGVDRLDAYGFLALQDAGLHVVPAQLALEQARAVKGPEEIELIRRSVRVCDAAVTQLAEDLRPGMTENEVWARFVGSAFAAGGSMSSAGSCPPDREPTRGSGRRARDGSSAAISCRSTPTSSARPDIWPIYPAPTWWARRNPRRDNTDSTPTPRRSSPRSWVS